MEHEKIVSSKFKKIFLSLLLSLALFLMNYFLSYKPSLMLLAIMAFTTATEYYLPSRYHQGILYLVPAFILVYLVMSDHWVIMLAGPVELGVVGMIFVGIRIGAWLRGRGQKIDGIRHD